MSLFNKNSKVFPIIVTIIREKNIVDELRRRRIEQWLKNALIILSFFHGF